MKLLELSLWIAVLYSALPVSAGVIRNPVGSAANTLAANDDGSTGAVNLGFSANLFGVTTDTIYVNNNGNVTFQSALRQYTPNGLAAGVGQPIIAAFFADVDTRGAGSGLVTYGTGTITDAAHGWLNAPLFAVEWPTVGYCCSHTDKLNTFEMLLVGRPDIGAGDFDIELNYGSIQWDQGRADAGYSNGLAGAANVYYQLPGAMISGAFIDGGPNALNGSRFDFLVRSGSVSGSVGDAPEPASMLLLLSGGALAVFRFRRRKSVG
jgi:hypothetical protein